LSGDADGVLRGQQYVQREDGVDVTDAFVDGAEKTLALCIRHGIHIAVLKEGSPSCGVNHVNDGTFAKHKIAAMGVTATLLQRHGIAVFSELQLAAVQQMLARLEPGS